METDAPAIVWLFVIMIGAALILGRRGVGRFAGVHPFVPRRAAGPVERVAGAITLFMGAVFVVVGLLGTVVALTS
ncbi:MAG TPA: hypothetical protein VN238_15880 [Solirubrobacteraceae bacterium]|nr:hypothetical protein [Solirubrobacteraceae bacterium]